MESPPEKKLSRTRALAQHDLFFLLTYVLNRKDCDNQWYFDRCREVQKSPDGHIDLWAREHGKSTVITFALTIQDILNDPEVTIGIFSHTKPIATDFLKQIKNEFEINKVLKACFPDILFSDPAKEAKQWSTEGITVKRKSNPKEATVEAWGLVDGQPIGRHFRVRVYDDVVTLKSVNTAEQISKTTEAYELSDNLGQIGGKVRIIGTRYHLNDTYASILKKEAAEPRIYPATANGRMDGIPVLFTQQEWERRKKTQSRKIIAAQLLQNPLADEDARFSPLWLRGYEIRPRTMNVAIMGDPSLGKNASSDNTAIAVVGIAANGAKYLLDGFCHRMPLSERWRNLRDLYIKWSVEPGVMSIQVGWERYGLQSDIEYFEERQRIEKINFAIKELNWVREGGQSKQARVDRLEPDFRNSRFALPAFAFYNGKPMSWRIEDDEESKLYQSVVWKEVSGITSAQKRMIEEGTPHLMARAIKRLDIDGRIYDLTERFIEEYMSFPVGAHDDLIDDVSRIYDMEMVEPMIVSQEALNPPVFFDS